MKRFFAHAGFFLLLSNLSYSQKITDMRVFPTNSVPELSWIYDNSQPLNIFQSRGYSISNEAREIRMEEGIKFWSVEMTGGSGGGETALVVFYNNSRQLERWILSVGSPDQTGKRFVAITDIRTLSFVFSGPIGPEPPTSERKTCREEHPNSFGDCFKCAWNTLNNSAEGIVACALLPEVCLAAAAIHCAPTALREGTRD